MPKAIDITGLRSGRLVALRLVQSETPWRVWECVCDCGVRVFVAQQRISNGRSRSCGCLKIELATKRLRAMLTKHGLTGTPGYWAWGALKKRCLNPKGAAYKNYGGRGIKVCDRWLDSFAAFLEDVGPRPSPLHSIDRYPDNNGNYEPGNVRWATRKQQNRNTRSYRGGAEIAEASGISPTMANKRLRAGLTGAALLKPPTRGGSPVTCTCGTCSKCYHRELARKNRAKKKAALYAENFEIQPDRLPDELPWKYESGATRRRMIAEELYG